MFRNTLLPDQEPFFTIPYTPAMFGGPVLTQFPFRIVRAFPDFLACSPGDVRVKAKGAVLLVGRGVCAFTKKAKYDNNVNQHIPHFLHDVFVE